MEAQLRKLGHRDRPPADWQQRVLQRIDATDRPTRAATKLGWPVFGACVLVLAMIAFAVIRDKNASNGPERTAQRSTIVRHYEYSDALARAERRIASLAAAVRNAANRERREQNLRALQRVREFRAALQKRQEDIQRPPKPKSVPSVTRPKAGDRNCLSKESSPLCDVYLDSRGGVVVECDPNDPLCGL